MSVATTIDSPTTYRSDPAHQGGAVSGMPPKTESDITRWKKRTPRLATWCMDRMVNRSDSYGQYIDIKKRKDGERENNSYTSKWNVTNQLLMNHFACISTGQVIGLHSTYRDPQGNCWCKWIAVDIDRHGEVGDPDINLRFAVTIRENLAESGIKCLILDSNGRGGIHLIVCFADRIPTASAYSFAQWLIRGWNSSGLSEAPETFPKQAAIKEGGFGNWLRMPGCHHTRQHLTRVWSGSGWLSGGDAADAILAIELARQDQIPVDALVPTGVKGQARPVDSRKTDAELAEEAMFYLGHMADQYDEWLKIGMCLSKLGHEGLALWDRWSSQATAKYQPGECAKKWDSFVPEDGLKLGTLFHLAKEAGWAGQQGRSQLASPSSNQKMGDDLTDEQCDEENEDNFRRQAATNVFKNWFWGVKEKIKFETEVGEDTKESKKEKEPELTPMPLRIAEIDDALRPITHGWPKRVNNDLFWINSKHEPEYLNSSTKMFAKLDSMALIDWKRGDSFVGQERYYEHRRMTSHRYDGVETLPHVPRLPDVFYCYPELPDPSDKLEKLVGFFSPASDWDRDLIKAFLVTGFWGGRPGSRPAFLITGEEKDEKQGLHIGKTTMLKLVAQLWGGSLDVTPTDEISDVKTRLLSEEGKDVRMAQIDNIKSLRLSWAELEGIITAHSISGRQLYKGEGKRPNMLTWGLTLNNASLGKDMASRSVTIKLTRSQKDADWEDTVVKFISDNRWSIIADCVAVLEKVSIAITPQTRFAAWEKEVLAKATKDLGGCQKLIVERQTEVDVDTDEMHEVREYIIERIRDWNHAHETCHVKIQSKVMADWASTALGGKPLSPNTATAKIKGLGIPELSVIRKADFRGWAWKGKDCEDEKPVDLNLVKLDPPPATRPHDGL